MMVVKHKIEKTETPEPKHDDYKYGLVFTQGVKAGFKMAIHKLETMLDDIPDDIITATLEDQDDSK